MTFLTKLKSLSCLGSRSQDDQEAGNTEQPPSSAGSAKNSSSIALLPPLKPITLPLVLPQHQAALPRHGWTTITPPSSDDPLLLASQALFRASKSFFALPASEKGVYATHAGSEEGWSRVEGEKEFITLRNLENTPPGLRHAAAEYWGLVGALLSEILGRVAESLGIVPAELRRLSEPCERLGEQRTATLLRLFRYEGVEEQETKIVAQAHKDLGLLSLVMGDTPGLEVWDKNIERWFQIERGYERPAATLLVGRQLERLSNGRYTAGGHLVRSYPHRPRRRAETPGEKNYRYSIVFVLRAHSPVMVNTDRLTTPITGEFKDPIRDIRAGQLFRDIKKAHFNINTGHEEREQQRLKLLKEKEDQATLENSHAADQNEKR